MFGLKNKPKYTIEGAEKTTHYQIMYLISNGKYRKSEFLIHYYGKEATKLNEKSEKNNSLPNNGFGKQWQMFTN